MQERLLGDAHRSDDPALGVVIERMVEVVAGLAAQYEPKPGRQPGMRLRAQQATCPLFWFMARRSPRLPIEKHRTFVFCCLNALEILCPNLNNDDLKQLVKGANELGDLCPSFDREPGGFSRWYAETEALAQPAPEAGITSPNDSPDSDAAARLRGKRI
jgi:hypothetical protein